MPQEMVELDQKPVSIRASRHDLFLNDFMVERYDVVTSKTCYFDCNGHRTYCPFSDVW